MATGSASHTGGSWPLPGDRFLVAEATATFGPIGFMRYDRRHEIAPAVQRALAAARRLGDASGEALMLNRLGQLHLDLGDQSEAIVHFGQQLERLEAATDSTGLARALNNLGISVWPWASRAWQCRCTSVSLAWYAKWVICGAKRWLCVTSDGLRSASARLTSR